MGAVPFGINPQGFVLKRLADILSDFQTALSAVSDPVTGEQLTPNLADENDPLVLLVNAFADSLATAWEQLQLAVNGYDPQSSIGAALSGLVQINGITRLAGTYSTVTLNLTGTAGTTMPSGAQAGTQDGTMVFNLPQVTFDGSGNATGIIGICTTIGPGPNAEPAGTVTQFVTPVSGWDTVTNPDAVVMGVAEETDEQLRSRQQASTANTAGTIIEAWYSALANIAGVTYARVYQNVTGSTDGRGIPANSIAPVVVGGADTDIANCLYSKFSVARLYGSTTINMFDALGTEYPMSFSRPASVPVYMALNLHVINADAWPDNGEVLVEDAITAFASGGMAALGVTNQYDQGGYAPGQAPYSSDFYPAILTIAGIQLVSCLIGLTPGPTGQSAAIAWNQQMSIIAANISITMS